MLDFRTASTKNRKAGAELQTSSKKNMNTQQRDDGSRTAGRGTWRGCVILSFRRSRRRITVLLVGFSSEKQWHRFPDNGNIYFITSLCWRIVGFFKIKNAIVINISIAFVSYFFFWLIKIIITALSYHLLLFCAVWGYC